MIAYVKYPTLASIREAKQRLVSRNVYPVCLYEGYVKGGVIDPEPSFIGYLGLIDTQGWGLLIDSCLTETERKQTFKEDSPIILPATNIRLYKSEFVKGAIIWGNNSNPVMTTVVE